MKAATKAAAQDRVGVRELRQNLSVYLDEVKRGRRYEVTEHGQPVALLVPRPPEPMNELDRMIADGRATAPQGDWRELNLPLPAPPGARPLSEVLRELREEEDF